MNKVDLSPLHSCDAEYNRLCNVVSEKFNTAWNDAVKNSFASFIRQLEENSRKLHGTRTSAELIEKAVDAHNIDGLQQKTIALIREAKSV